MDAKRFRVVAIVAAALFAPQLAVHVLISFTMVPTFKSLFESMGGTLPWPTAIVVALGPWLGVVMGVVDALVFWLFYRLARKYWVGLLFAPILAGGLLAAPLVWALYAPMFEVVSLIK